MLLPFPIIICCNLLTSKWPSCFCRVIGVSIFYLPLHPKPCHQPRLLQCLCEEDALNTLPHSSLSPCRQWPWSLSPYTSTKVRPWTSLSSRATAPLKLCCSLLGPQPPNPFDSSSLTLYKVLFQVFFINATSSVPYSACALSWIRFSSCSAFASWVISSASLASTTT